MKNFHVPADGGEPYGPLDAIRHVREAGITPDGEVIPPHLKPTLLALSTYWPTIRPTVETLARDTGLGRRTVLDHLRELRELDLVRTHNEGRTAYRLLQLDRLVYAAPIRRTATGAVGRTHHAARRQPVRCDAPIAPRSTGAVGRTHHAARRQPVRWSAPKPVRRVAPQEQWKSNHLRGNHLSSSNGLRRGRARRAPRTAGGGSRDGPPPSPLTTLVVDTDSTSTGGNRAPHLPAV